MDEISNRTIAVLLVAAIAVSLGGTLMTLNKVTDKRITGFASSNQTGTASVEVQSVTEITLVNSVVDFGGGFVNASGTCQNCTMVSNGTYNNACCLDLEGSGWTDNTTYQHGFLIRNDGNYNVSLRMNASTNAQSLINGTNPLLQVKPYQGFESTYSSTTDDTEDACSGGFTTSGWMDVNTSNQYICGGDGGPYDFTYGSTKDEIEMLVQVAVPIDSERGAMSADIQFTAQSGG